MKQFKFKQRLFAFLLLPAFLIMQGCTSQATLAALASTLGNAAASVATLEGNTALSAKLTADTAAATAAITNWKKGTPATEAIEALNLVEDDLNLIPATSNYAPLIDLAIGTAESILALLPQSPAPAGATAVRRVALQNPPKNSKDFKKQWAAIIAANPQLAGAAIK